MQYMDYNNVVSITQAILAACVLHNLCIGNGDEIEDDYRDNICAVESEEPQDAEEDGSGAVKRLQTTNQL